MGFIDKINILNSIVSQLELPEDHILLRYAGTASDYNIENARTSFFYQDYFSLVRGYCYASSSYKELMLFMNIEGEVGFELRNDIRLNYNLLERNYYTPAEIKKKITAIQTLIKTLKDAGISVDELEVNLNGFEQHFINHNEVIFELNFLEIMHGELTQLLPPPHEEINNVSNNNIFSIIAMLFIAAANNICLNSRKISADDYLDSNTPNNDHSHPDPDLGGKDGSVFSCFPFGK